MTIGTSGFGTANTGGDADTLASVYIDEEGLHLGPGADVFITNEDGVEAKVTGSLTHPDIPLYGLANADFGDGPIDPTMTITPWPSLVASNFMPNWRFVQVSNTNITLSQVQDSAAPSGSNMRFTFVSGASDDEARIEQVVPVNGSRAQSVGSSPRSFAITTGGYSNDVLIYSALQYLDVTGTPVGAETTDSTVAPSGYAGISGGSANISTDLPLPSAARYLRIRIGVQRYTALVTDAPVVNIRGAFLDTGLGAYRRSVYERGGIHNGDFGASPPDPSKPINSDLSSADYNPLPGWLLVDDSNGTMVATWVADATVGSGGHVRVAVIAGAADTETLILRQIVSVKSSISRNDAILTVISANGSDLTETLYVGFSSQYVKADGTTPTGSPATNRDLLHSVGTYFDIVDALGGPAAIPANAGYIQLDLIISRETGTTNGHGSCTLYAAQLIPGVFELVLPDTVSPAIPAGRIRQRNGVFQFYPAGATTSTLVLPQAVSPAQTAEGSIVWDIDDDLLTVGTGAGRKTMLDTTAAAAAYIPTSYLDTDGTLAVNSDVKVATQKATKTYVDAHAGAGISDGDKGDVVVSGSGAVWTVDTGVVTLAKMADIATAKVIGRATAGTGVPEALATTGTGSVVLATSPTLVTPILGTPTSGVATNLTGTAAGLTAGNVTTNANLTGNVTSVGNATTLAAGSASNLDSGTLLAARMPALTGDVTTSAGAVATTIGAGKVTLAMQANLAVDTLIGRATAGTGVPEAIALTAAGRALIDDAAATNQRTTLGLAYGTGPVAGALAATDGASATVADEAHVHPGFQSIILTADFVKTTGIAGAFADLTGLSFPCVSGKKYLIQGFGTYTCSALTGGINLAYNAPAGTVFAEWEVATTGVGAYDIVVRQASTDNTNAGAASVNSTASHPFRFAIRYVCTANGTFTLRVARTGTVNTVTVEAGSGMFVGVA